MQSDYGSGRRTIEFHDDLKKLFEKAEKQMSAPATANGPEGEEMPVDHVRRVTIFRAGEVLHYEPGDEVTMTDGKSYVVAKDGSLRRIA